MAPGETITAMLSIERNGFDGELKFDVDNLPHGVIVATAKGEEQPMTMIKRDGRWYLDFKSMMPGR